jgi:hypothetical protein
LTKTEAAGLVDNTLEDITHWRVALPRFIVWHCLLASSVNWNETFEPEENLRGVDVMPLGMETSPAIHAPLASKQCELG